MKIKERIKKYFTDKPKSDFWLWAFVTVVLFKYVTPLTLMMLIPFQVGLIAPDTQVNYQNISITVVNRIIKPMEVMNNLGANLGYNHPIISKVLFYALSNFIWVIWVMMIVLCLNLFRYFISWIYRRSKNGRRK